MSRARRWVAWIVLATVAGGHALCFAFDQEAWPFLVYPMFSRPLRSDAQSALLLEGVDSDGRSFPLRLRHTWPLFRSRLALRLATVQRTLGPTGSREALRQLAALYERNRPRHDGPHLARLRLMRCRWSASPAHLRDPWPDGCELVEDVGLQEPAP